MSRAAARRPGQVRRPYATKNGRRAFHFLFPFFLVFRLSEYCSSRCVHMYFIIILILLISLVPCSTCARKGPLRGESCALQSPRTLDILKKERERERKKKKEMINSQLLHAFPHRHRRWFDHSRLTSGSSVRPFRTPATAAGCPIKKRKSTKIEITRPRPVNQIRTTCR